MNFSGGKQRIIQTPTPRPQDSSAPSPFVLFCFCFLSTKSCSLCLFTCLVLNIGSSVQIGCQKSRKFNTMFCKYNINVLPKWNGNLVLSYLFFSRSLCWFKNLFTPQKKVYINYFLNVNANYYNINNDNKLFIIFFPYNCYKLIFKIGMWTKIKCDSKFKNRPARMLNEYFITCTRLFWGYWSDLARVSDSKWLGCQDPQNRTAALQAVLSPGRSWTCSSGPEVTVP